MLLNTYLSHGKCRVISKFTASYTATVILTQRACPGSCNFPSLKDFVAFPPQVQAQRERQAQAALFGFQVAVLGDHNSCLAVGWPLCRPFLSHHVSHGAGARFSPTRPSWDTGSADSAGLQREGRSREGRRCSMEERAMRWGGGLRHGLAARGKPTKCPLCTARAALLSSCFVWTCSSGSSASPLMVGCNVQQTKYVCNTMGRFKERPAPCMSSFLLRSLLTW